VEAVLASLADRPSLAERTVAALADNLETEPFQRLMAGIKRADRIVPRDAELELRPEDLPDPADRALWAAYQQASSRAQSLAPDQLDELVAAMLPLTQPIDQFFADVLVMAEDPAVRQARLALLKSIRDLPARSFEVSRLPAPTAPR
jgi:glycyl-tRNA synthetase